MKNKLNFMLAGIFLSGAANASAAVRYVDANSASPAPPYTTWVKAAHVIQDAVDAAVAGDEIVVTNGVYATGGRAVGTNVLVNRVVVDKPLMLRSVNGPQFTIIQGYRVPGTTNGDGAIRCAYLASGANLFGFTLTNGATRMLDGLPPAESHGGGVWCEGPNAAVSNCVLAGNSAYSVGGGVCGGTLNNCALTRNSANQGGGAGQSTLNNCTLISNSAVGYGGGVSLSTLNNCTVTGNSASACGGGADASSLNNCTLRGNSAGGGGGASWSGLNNCVLTGNSASWAGGGAYRVMLDNCTVSGNSADSDGGGVYGGWLANCIVYFNTAPSGANCSLVYVSGGISLDYCCTTLLPTNGIGNITNAPLFVDHAAGNLRLQSNSPCINAGNNAYQTTATDMDGNPRIVSGTVDIGVYEYQGTGSRISYAWLQHYGLPTDGSADDAHGDADGMNNWQEWVCGTCPTNPLSALRLISAAQTHSNVTVTWQSVAGVNYLLERSPNPSSPFLPVATNILGQAGTTGYSDSNTNGAGPSFYRVGVLWP
jgi:parallel beta-helix repeat protein